MSAPSIESLYRELISTWNDRDARAYGALFTPDGTLVGFDGSEVGPRSAIVEHLEQVFSDHETAPYITKVREVRMVGADGAILRGVAGMVPPGESAIKPEVNAVQALVAVRREARWRVAHFQSTPAAFHGRPDAVEELTAELEAARSTG